MRLNSCLRQGGPRAQRVARGDDDEEGGDHDLAHHEEHLRVY